MFGGNFGAESAARDATQHSKGRRHGPLDMNHDTGVSKVAMDNTIEAQRAFQSHRAVQQRHIETGPSFLDSMFANRSERERQANPGASLRASGTLSGDALTSSQTSPNASGAGGGLPRGSQKGKEPLNLFKWNDEYQQKGLREKLMMERDSELRSLCPPESPYGPNFGDLRRDDDAKKFERSTDNHFLNFDDGKMQGNIGRKSLAPGNANTPFAVNYEQREGLADREIQSPSRRRQGPVKTNTCGTSFEGFPGLGGANGGIASNYAPPSTYSAASSPSHSSSPTQPLPHRAVPRPISNVFLPDIPNGSEALLLAPQSGTSTEIQRRHQLRTRAEVGFPCPSSTTMQRHLGPYSTSNASYGVNDDERMSRSFSYSKAGGIPGEAMNVGGMGGVPPHVPHIAGGGGAGRVPASYGDYGGYPPSVGSTASSLPPSQLAYQQAPPSYASYPPSSYASGGSVPGRATPSSLRRDLYSLGDGSNANPKAGALGSAQMPPYSATTAPIGLPPQELEMEEYEQDLRRRLQERRQQTGGEIGEEDMTGGAGAGYGWNPQDRLEPTAYDYSPDKGFMETPREPPSSLGGAALRSPIPSGGFAGVAGGSTSQYLDGNVMPNVGGKNPYAVDALSFPESEHHVRFQT